MQKAKPLFIGLFVLLIGYLTFTVFLADNALVKRTVKTEGPNGGYKTVTDRGDGTTIIETYALTETGAPESHVIILIDSETNEQLRVIKSGTF